MDADNASSAMNITVMNLESGETQRFAADDGQKIRHLALSMKTLSMVWQTTAIF